MDIIQVLKSEYVSILAGGLGGILTTWLSQRLLNKRGLFAYTVTHSRVGITTDDAVFGSVAVSWNGQPTPNLFFSELEMKNESMNDYENVVVRTHTDTARLLTERTQLLGTPHVLRWSERFKEDLHVSEGEKPTTNQLEIYNGQREHVIPIFNRGDMIKISYLNSSKSDGPPSIWLSVEQKGVTLKFRELQALVLGVPQIRAALIGVLLGVGLLAFLSYWDSGSLLVAAIAMAYGLIAQFPGAYILKGSRRLRELIGG